MLIKSAILFVETLIINAPKQCFLLGNNKAVELEFVWHAICSYKLANEFI